MGLFFAKQYINFYPVEIKVASSTSKVEEECLKANPGAAKEADVKDPLDRINESPPDPTDI